MAQPSLNPFSLYKFPLRDYENNVVIYKLSDKRKCMFFSTSKARRSPPSWDILRRDRKEIDRYPLVDVKGFQLACCKTETLIRILVKHVSVKTTDVLYKNASAHCLHMLANVYHLPNQPLSHWYVFIYKSILDISLFYLSILSPGNL